MKYQKWIIKLKWWKVAERWKKWKKRERTMANKEAHGNKWNNKNTNGFKRQRNRYLMCDCSVNHYPLAHWCDVFLMSGQRVSGGGSGALSHLRRQSFYWPSSLTGSGTLGCHLSESDGQCWARRARHRQQLKDSSWSFVMRQKQRKRGETI